MASKAALEEKALQAIPAYMLETNRPYSAIDVYNNLRQEYGKALVVRALEHGVSIGTLKEKIISKQKIFFVDQDKLPVSDDSALADLDKEIARRGETYASLSAKYRAYEKELALGRSSETTAALRAALEASRKEVESLRTRVSVLESSRDACSAAKDAEAEGRRLLAKEDSMAALVNKRKRMAFRHDQRHPRISQYAQEAAFRDFCYIVYFTDSEYHLKFILQDSIGLEVEDGEL